MDMLNHWFFNGQEQGILRCFERLDEREGGISGFQGSGVLSQFIKDDDGVTPSMESAARKIRGLRVDRMLACRTFGRKATEAKHACPKNHAA